MTKQFRHAANAALLRVIAVTGALTLFTLMTATVAQMQGKKPYDQSTLLKVVQLNALPTSEVVGKVNERGVDFQMTSGLESEFRSAGARPEVIEAIRENYRAAAAP